MRTPSFESAVETRSKLALAGIVNSLWKDLLLIEEPSSDFCTLKVKYVNIIKKIYISILKKNYS